MFFTEDSVRVFVYEKLIDMRCGFERLSYYVREEFGEDLLEGHLFLFLGKNRRRAKVLFFDKTGLILLTKRLEGGKLMALRDLEEVSEISLSELRFLLSGSLLRFASRRKKSA